MFVPMIVTVTFQLKQKQTVPFYILLVTFINEKLRDALLWGLSFLEIGPPSASFISEI